MTTIFDELVAKHKEIFKIYGLKPDLSVQKITDLRSDLKSVIF